MTDLFLWQVECTRRGYLAVKDREGRLRYVCDRNHNPTRRPCDPGDPGHSGSLPAQCMLNKRRPPMTSNILKFRTIAVATDLSDPASAALRYAQAMARMYQSILVVVHVIDPLAYAFPEGAPSVLAANQSAVAELRKIEEETSCAGHSRSFGHGEWDRLRSHLGGLEGAPCRSAGIGNPRQRRQPDGSALGTVARQLLARSRCPILTVSPDAAKSLPWAGCWGRVLAATDFSPASIRALRCAHQVALRQLIVLHAPECREKRGRVPGAIAFSRTLQ